MADAGYVSVGSGDRSLKQLKEAFSSTMKLLSFVPDEWPGHPPWEDALSSIRDRPSIYAITYRYAPPDFLHEISMYCGTSYEANFLYVGKAEDPAVRLATHRNTLKSRCGDDGLDLGGFRIYLVHVKPEEVWALTAFETLLIDYCRPLFNETVKGLGSGGSKAFDLYLTHPSRLNAAQQQERERIAERVNGVLNDESRRPRELTFDGPDPIPPELERQLAKDDWFPDLGR